MRIRIIKKLFDLLGCCTSSTTSTPCFFAFAHLLPAFSPATRISVFFDKDASRLAEVLYLDVLWVSYDIIRIDSYFHQGDHSMLNWFSNIFLTVLEELMRILVTFALAILVNIIAIYGYTAAWQLYMHTHIGERFLEISPELAGQISILLDQTSLLMFSFEIAKVTLMMALLVAVVAQFFFIRHVLYTNAHLLFKALFCLALASGLAFYHMESYGLTSFNVAIVLFAPASFILLPACMTTASKLIPDLGQLILGSLNIIRGIFSR